MSGWLIVGLGNPGPTYAGHRHNVGAMVVAELARRAGVGFTGRTRMRAETAETRIGPAGIGVVGPGADKLVLARTRTYMNESGVPTATLAGFHQIGPDHVIAVHDELDIAYATLRSKLGGGDNGHNGLKSIRAHLGTGDFLRVRVGIGRPPGRQEPADYVLSDFSGGQREELPLLLDRAADACETIMTEGLTVAQNRFNS